MDGWKYTPASAASHATSEHFWNYIGRNFTDRGDPEKHIEFTIIDVCTCNKFEDLFFKYVELEKFSSYIKRCDDKICDYSTCKEILEGEEYIFDNEEVFLVLLYYFKFFCLFVHSSLFLCTGTRS